MPSPRWIGKGYVMDRAWSVAFLSQTEAAMNHADRAVVLDGGSVVADGVPEEALEEEAIARVWGVCARWLGERGGRALAIR